MFAIYNNNGLSFRSTIDNFYNLSNVDSIARSRNNVNEGLPKDHSVKDKKKLYEKKSLKEASEAYKRVANIDTKEQIFHIKDLMTKDVITLTQENTLLEAYNLMEDNDIRQIPIMSEDNHIMGLLTHKMLLDVLVNDIEFARNTIKKKY